jgi:hypothetical protein
MAAGCSSQVEPPNEITAETQQASTPPVNVLERGYTLGQTGANISEPILTAANVQGSNFQKLFGLTGLDDQVFAQILYVANVPFTGLPTQNAIFVETANNSLYAFNADTGAFIWHKNFNNGFRPPTHAELGSPRGDGDFSANVGAISTPAIDLSTSTLYIVSHTLESGNYVYRLHAIDIRTGSEKTNSPKQITATVSGVALDASLANQRPGLAISNNTVYIAFASYADSTWYGWLLAYDETSLAQVGVFNAAPTGQRAGIWQSGAAPAIDGVGNVYVATGNGYFDGVTNWGDSVLKFSPKLAQRLDSFTPYNQQFLNTNDLDLGVAGPALLPDSSNRLVQGGKYATMYLLNGTSLGGYNPNGDSQIPDEISAIQNNCNGCTWWYAMFSGTIPWNGPSGMTVYVWGLGDFPRAYAIDASSGKFARTSSGVPISLTAGTELPVLGIGSMSLSANGSQAGTGILWLSTTQTRGGYPDPGPGRLVALDADNLNNLLFSSTDVGNGATFNPPTVANGRVYVPSFSTGVSAFGLCQQYGPYQTWSTLTFNGQYGNFLADVDGDQKADLVGLGNGYIGVLRTTWPSGTENGALRVGTSFGPYETWSTTTFAGTHGTLIGDVNHDGKADLVALNDSEVDVRTSTGSSSGGFAAAAEPTPTSSST